MYVILVYDIEEERLTKVRQYVRRYLNWVQNSAFEGELSEGKLEQMKAGLQDIIEPERDSVYLYILREARWMDKQVLGQTKSLTDNIL